ncbi:MAG TPA: hypothetical protein EYG34_02175 [Acidimicrobiia bacterium]|jgi:hypothetical protein|nr:hypothetical protein [Acidimicrobiia bacterium]HIL45908.1 hypothetical protein [Acidimicrobiia bacterium]
MDVEIIFSLISSFLPLALIVGVVVAVQRGRTGDRDVGSSVQRVLIYGFLAVVVMLVATGVDDLASRIIEKLEGEDPSAPAWAAARVLVGGGALLLLIRMMRRRFATQPGEQSTLAWMFYQGVMELTALGVMTYASVNILQAIIGDGSFSIGYLVTLAVWGYTWNYHVRLGDRIISDQPVRSSFTLLGGSMIGLVGSVVAFGALAVNFAVWGYEAATGEAMWEADFDVVRDILPFLLVFGAIWFWYWVRQVVPAGESNARHAFTLIVGVLGGLGTMVGVAAGMIAMVLHWVFVDEQMSAAQYFHPWSAMVAVAAVACLVWRYHRSLLPSSEGRARSEVNRAYDYLALWVGLAAMVVGIGMLFFSLLQLVTPLPVGEERVLTDFVIAAFTGLLVGSLVWRNFWPSVQAFAKGAAEVKSTVRRVFLYSVFGIAALVALVDLLVLVTMLFEAVFDEGLGRQALWDTHPPLSLVLTAGVVAGYHLMVLRSDKEVVAVLEPVDSPSSEPEESAPVYDLDAVATAVTQASAGKLVLVERADGLHLEETETNG